MGNNGSALGDEPNNSILATRNLQHFDHAFKAELHTAVGSVFTETFGECKFSKRSVSVVCKAGNFEIVEDVGLTARKQITVSYVEINSIAWDHANSEVKFGISRSEEENYVILTMSNSIEFEGELKLRFSGAAQNSDKPVKIPSPMYIGMFAGATKPKPFQRKRPNLSHLPAGKLPSLHEMRNSAIELHKGSYRPCPSGESRRLQIALQHIYEGCNTFALLNVRGASSVANQCRPDSILIITDEALIFKPRGSHSDLKVEFNFEDITEWSAVDNDNSRLNDSGVEIISASGDTVFFGVQYIRDVKHTLEYFWNKYQVSNGGSVKLGSTHGRPIVSVHTLSGEITPPEAPIGQTDVIDQDGILVRPGGKMLPRRGSLTGGVMQSKEPKIVPPENRDVKKHWHKVVLHQGWLLKQGGIGVGSAKSWIKRYFVLYKTSQGHFLVYYSDFTECPMYTSEKFHRNIVDLAKATFIRPGSNKSETNPDIPPYSFDIVTTEREWTLCAESQENVLKWLQLITRAVDEDVAILPDEELLFHVKPKVDPLGVLPATDYSTALKVSANGISVCTPETENSGNGAYTTTVTLVMNSSPDKEHYFWVYTDFYKWSLLSQAGKIALLVNVFADSSFSRRNEYIFRTKEAVRLATAIEYFIEKFMSVMHIRLETQEGAFNDVPPIAEDNKTASTAVQGGLHNVHVDEVAAVGYQPELDLLDLGGDDESSYPMTAAPNVPHPPVKATSAFGSDDPFGDDPFGSSEPSHAPPVPTSRPPPSSSSTTMDLLDTFTTPDAFGSDPFGNDAFVPPAAPPAAKIAPPLSPIQIQQFKDWNRRCIASGSGPIYEDGTLRVVASVEIRGSQCRLTVSYYNLSPAAIVDLVITVTDDGGLIRYQLSPLPSNTIAGLGQSQQVMMAECVKPAYPGPKITFAYQDTLIGKRSHTIELPILVTSFNEPLVLNGPDFQSRWQMLTAVGQEAKEIITPSYPIVPSQVLATLVSIFKFSRITSIPDASDYVLYGAASLRTGTTTPTGEKISVGCLTKIEMNVQSNAIRVTLRTLHPAATVAIMETVKQVIA